MKLGRSLACVLFVGAAIAAGCGGGSNGSGFDLTPTEDASSGSHDGSVSGDDGSTVPGFDATFGGDDSGVTEAGISDGACVSGDAGPPPFKQRCAPATTNECAGPTDQSLTSISVSASLLNGTTGNGFDDDCDGLVDEGCSCPAAGTTKDCYLVPASQADPTSKKPVGWCTDNSKGSLDCAGTEFPKWSGTCRGAQPPYAHDICAVGDFNCDGLPQNSDTTDCSCHTAVVTCPTAPLQEKPFPSPTAIQKIDGTTWIANGQAAQATGWKWTVLGGDCDNILPHPTFAIYNNTNSTAANARIGTRTPIQFNATSTPPEYMSTSGSPLISMQAATGNGLAGGVVYPAFALSGDYVVQGEFDLANTHYVCTQKVEVRADGIRAELCWDTVGQLGGLTNGGANDIDLHFARLQGITCTGKNGWDNTCTTGGKYQDCWWDNVGGCRDDSANPPGWGYSDSPDSACIGWGSKRHQKGSALGTYTQGCTNPRLDRDNITCDPTVDDPNSQATDINEFCGPENINLDNPADNDSFVVGVNHFGNSDGTSNAKVHVNLYCQGARVLSVGYNPASTPPSQNPLLNKAGADSTGDLWAVGTVKWHAANGATPASCDVVTIPSVTPDPTRDGTNNKQVCVDSTGTGAPKPYKNHKFNEATGAIPTTAAGFCKH